MANQDTILQSTDASFQDDVLNNDKPVLVDFWAEWCGPCRALGPVFEELAASYLDKVQFVKINIDENRETPAQYAVRSIPTLLLFKQGEVVATRLGSATKKDLSEFIDSHI